MPQSQHWFDVYSCVVCSQKYTIHIHWCMCTHKGMHVFIYASDVCVRYSMLQHVQIFVCTYGTRMCIFIFILVCVCLFFFIYLFLFFCVFMLLLNGKHIDFLCNEMYSANKFAIAIIWCQTCVNLALLGLIGPYLHHNDAVCPQLLKMGKEELLCCLSCPLLYSRSDCRSDSSSNMNGFHSLHLKWKTSKTL